MRRDGPARPLNGRELEAFTEAVRAYYEFDLVEPPGPVPAVAPDPGPAPAMRRWWRRLRGR